MNNRYLFQPTDEVIHSYYPDLKGVIVQQMSCVEGDRCEELDPTDPWYRIQWSDGLDGFESEGALLPSYVNTSPTKRMIHLWETDRELWKKLTTLPL